MLNILEDEVKKITGQYRDLGKELRHMIGDELKRNDYEHLKNPCTKTKKQVSLQDMKFRFNILPRLPNKTGNGVRNLGVGDDEIVLCTYSMFNDWHDYEQGMDFVQGYSPFRLVFGRYSAFPRFTEEVFDQFMSQEDESKKLLNNGEYLPFVQRTLPIINDNMGIFKALIKDVDYKNAESHE